MIVWICLIKLKNIEQSKQSKLFNGIKLQRKHRLYPSTLLIRRTIFVSFLIWLVIVQSRVLIAILSLIQLFYLVYISYLRPYIETKDNIIEIMNEVYFLLLLFLLIFFNNESDWSSITTSAYMWTISSNSIVSFLIVFGNSEFNDFIVNLIRVSMIKLWKKGSTQIHVSLLYFFLIYKVMQLFI